MAKGIATKATPALGVESQGLVAHIAHGLSPEVRASSGLATALHALYAAKLEDAEDETERLGKSCSEDVGAAYARQVYRTQELRGLVAILATLEKTLTTATGRADRIAELTVRCLKGGAR
jgi:hypothetical protein